MDLTTALDDQAVRLAAMQRANEVAKILATAADAAGGLATGADHGHSSLATGARISEDLLGIVVDAIARVDLATLQAMASRSRQQWELRGRPADCMTPNGVRRG